MAVNDIETRTLFAQACDQQLIEGCTSGWMEDNASQVQYSGGATVKILTISTTGLGNYDRNKGHKRGAVSAKFTPYTMTQDRSASFLLDRMDVEESGFLVTAAATAAEFQSENVIPEVDAYRYSKIFKLADDKGYSSEYTPAASTILSKLKDDITAIRDSGAGKAQLDNAVLKDTDKYVPMRTGVLKKSGVLGTRVGSGEIVYIAPYAKKCYYGVTIRFPVVFDYEDSKCLTPKLTKAEYTAICKTFLDEIRAAGYYAMLYCNKSFLEIYADKAALLTYPLWLAHYVPEGRQAQYGQKIWQFGKFRPEGAVGDVDGNFAYEQLGKTIREGGLNVPVRYRLTAQKTVYAWELVDEKAKLEDLGCAVTTKKE